MQLAAWIPDLRPRALASSTGGQPLIGYQRPSDPFLLAETPPGEGSGSRAARYSSLSLATVLTMGGPGVLGSGQRGRPLTSRSTTRRMGVRSDSLRERPASVPKASLVLCRADLRQYDRCAVLPAMPYCGCPVGSVRTRKFAPRNRAWRTGTRERSAPPAHRIAGTRLGTLDLPDL